MREEFEVRPLQRPTKDVDRQASREYMRGKKNKWGPCLSISTLGKFGGKDQNYIRINNCPMCRRNLCKEAGK